MTSGLIGLVGARTVLLKNRLKDSPTHRLVGRWMTF